MLRIVDGMIFEGKPSADRWRVVEYDLGHGQREVVASRCMDWHEVGPLHPESILAQVLRGERDDPDADEKAAANAARAARRAKTTLRRRVKSMGCTRMLTLTYRDNMQDLVTCKRHVALFVKRLRRLLPGFAYVAGFETQKRGAWHVHMAVHALPARFMVQGHAVKSWDVVRRLWRSVIGGSGGNIDDAGARKNRSPARIASYLSKYLLKAFEDGADWSKRWQSSQHAMPEAVAVELRAESVRELFAMCFAFVDAGGAEFSLWLHPFGDSLYCASGPPGVDTSIHRRV